MLLKILDKFRCLRGLVASSHVHLEDMHKKLSLSHKGLRANLHHADSCQSGLHQTRSPPIEFWSLEENSGLIHQTTKIEYKRRSKVIPFLTICLHSNRLFALCALTLLLLVSQLSTLSAEEETPEEKGMQIALAASESNEGFGDFSAELTMVIRDRRGGESTRQMRFKVLEVPDDGDKSLFVFDQPRDVKGTALLTHAHINAPDDQWLYLPALQKVKRISASERSGSFMGSEFAYEDMRAGEVAEYTYKYLREEPCGELTCTVIEQYPLDEKSGYSKKVIWQDTEELRSWKMELYDRKDSHLKTLTFAKYKQYLDKFWRAEEQTMENHLTGASTVLKWTEFEFGKDLDESEFTQTALRRIR